MGLHMCALSTAPPDLGPEADRLARGNRRALGAAARRDEQRRAAFAHAEASGFQTPEAWSGVAAFWSGDSMSLVGLPVVPPGPELTGTAISGAVALSAVRGDVLKRAARLKRFLESGRNIAAGGPGRMPPEEP